MKFKKIAFGLVACSFLFTSCNKALDHDSAKQWVADHYKIDADSPIPAYALSEWDFHSNKGSKADSIVDKVLAAMGKEEDEEGLNGLIPTRKPEQLIGHEYHVEKDDIEVVQLNKDNFPDKFSTDAKNDIYKINNGSLSVTYKYDELYDDSDKDPKNWKYLTTTRIRVYNQKGYCTDFGCKVDGKWIDDDNSVKFKVLIHFIYSDDPIIE